MKPHWPGLERNVVMKHDLVEALADQDRAKLTAVRRDRREAFENLVLECSAGSLTSDSCQV